jgi:hypothetical integral membrane protein (TIGR02206 family)
MNPSHTVFVAYGPAHCVVLFLMVAAALVMILLARRDPEGPLAKILAWLLAGLLLGVMLTMLFHGIVEEPQDAVDLLPMHLCDWLSLIAPAALIFRRQFLYEITYFLGLAGTIHGVLTPDLAYGFPHFYFFTFFLAHCGIIVAVAYMTFGLGMRPYPVSLLRAFLFIQFYMLCAGAVNLLLDTNFGYLRAKPHNPSLIDHLGPWPWYLLAMEVMAALFFLIYYAPWWIKDRVVKVRSRMTND